MSLLQRTVVPQFLHKNNAFRALGPAWSRRSSSNVDSKQNLAVTPHQPNGLMNPIQLNIVQHTMSTQINTVRSLHTTIVANSLKERLMKTIGLHRDSKSNLLRAGFLLYEEACDKIDYQKFIVDFGRENTFYSWFVFNQLHVWMLMVRAMAAEGDKKDRAVTVRNAIVEAMWRDVGLRVKKLGYINSKTFREQIYKLEDQFQYSVVALDEGLLADDKQLASAIWREIFDGESDDFEKIESLVKYVRMNIAMLDRIPTEEFIHKRRIQWVDISAT